MKILYVTTISNTVNAFLIPHIRMLIDMGHTVDLAFNVEQVVNPILIEMGCNVFEVPFSRTPLSKGNIDAYKTFKKIVNDNKYDLVHTHTPVASVIVRLVCKGLKDTKVFYTAHGFHFYKGAPLKNWLIYYTLEKWLSKYTDTLITINKEDYNRAKENFKAKKVEYIPGVGLDINKFRNVEVNVFDKRKSIGVPVNAFVILSVGELNKNKNHEVIIRAVAKLNNPKIHYVICGKGPLQDYLNEVSINLGVENKIHILGYRNDIASICKSCDIFAFPSLREGLGMAALEAMACGLPLITSNVHGIVDYSINGVTGYNCSPKDVVGFVKSIELIFNHFRTKSDFCIRNENIINGFSLSNVINRLTTIYVGRRVE